MTSRPRVLGSCAGGSAELARFGDCAQAESGTGLRSVLLPEPSSVPVPNVVEPSLNVTIPVGIPEPGALAATVAVNVTD